MDYSFRQFKLFASEIIQYENDVVFDLFTKLKTSYSQMGMCFTSPPGPQNKISASLYALPSNNLNQKEQNILKLIYNDLKLRIPQKALNLQNFLLFFHKNGFWGIRLFQQFSFDESNLITEEEFVNGIAKLIKTNQDKKIQLLFKFFASSSSSSLIQSKSSPKRTDSLNKKLITDQNVGQKGVKFEQFLVMLYNYPKEDLKEILNDKDFFFNQIKNSLVTIGQNRRLQSVYNLGLSLNKKDSIVFCLEDKSQANESAVQKEHEMQPSMVGKDILRQIKRRETDETTLKLKDGDKTLEVKTNNIHHLVKKFAINMFRTLNLNYRTGNLSIKQFTEWVKQHNNLYNNYYDGFHNDIWELDQETHRPKYLSTPSEKQAVSKYQLESKIIKSYILLRHSVILICEDHLNDRPIDVICLQGLQVNKIFQQKHGYGFSISHRQGFYPLRKIFLKNQSIRDDWNESLKFYKGGSVENIYSMGKKIGTGKFSVVYEAVNKQAKNQVAIKVIEYKELDIDARKLIAHESSIMQIFCHPLLVQFKDCIQTKTHMYIITQLCPGKDLFQFVKDFKHLQQNEAAFIVQQIIVGIRYMHSLGIIHRDLKPQNIMVSYNARQKKIETVKIIDFGFANYLSTFADMSPDCKIYVISEVLAGTPNYIAPQLLRGEPICYKTDNFAIGSILYFMLSGTLPFNSHTLTDIFAKTLDGDYSFRGKIWQKMSDKAKNLIDSFLKTDPQDRISLQEALKHGWFKEIKERKIKVVLQPNSNQSQGIQSTKQVSI